MTDLEDLLLRFEEQWSRINALVETERQFTALRRALAALEAEMRKERPGYHITDREWADKLAAILAQHPEAPR